MLHLTLISIATIIIVVLALVIWRRTRSISFLLGIGIIYYFTLLGGLIISLDLLTGNIMQYYGMNYYYLFEKMFPVFLDSDYFMALFFYSFFIILIEITLIALLPTKIKKQNLFNGNDIIFISHARIIMFSIVFASISFMITGSYINEALKSGNSAYILIRYADETIPFYTVHQICIRMAIFVLPFAIATYLSGQDGQYFRGSNHVSILMLYGALSTLLLTYLTLLGNRNELLTAIITGFLFYIVNKKKINRLAIGLLTVGAVGLLGVIGSLRGTSPLELIDLLEPDMFVGGILNAITSNEIIASHLSLYGALHFQIPFVFGQSLLSLVASIIPSILWQNRPPDIYWHYFNHIDAVPGQGYAIHHATGWYLNFGILGIAVGAIIIGFIWAECFKRFQRYRWRQSTISSIFTILSPWIFIGALFPLLRGGLEGYKAFIVEHYMIPILLLTWSIKKSVYRINCSAS